MRNNLTLVLILCSLSLLIGEARANSSATTINYKVRFRALSFSMGCTNETPPKQKEYFAHDAATPGDKDSECFDMRRQVGGIKPTGIDVKHDDRFDTFEVVIHLKDDDAKAVAELTKGIAKDGSPERVLTGADGTLVSSGYMNEPFSGNDYFLSASSHDDAHNLAARLVTKLEKRP